jgi:hypothetical protein
MTGLRLPFLRFFVRATFFVGFPVVRADFFIPEV